MNRWFTICTTDERDWFRELLRRVDLPDYGCGTSYIFGAEQFCREMERKYNQPKNENETMSQNLPNPGTYRSKTNGPIVIYEAASGALCAAIPWVFPMGDGSYNGKHTATLVKANGEVQTKTVENLKKIFAWDGEDPFWLSENDLSNCEFDIVGEHDSYTKEGETEPRTVFKSQWMNPPGESGLRMPEAADKKAVLAKYGNKFRALSKPASKSSTPVATKKTAPKTATAAPPAPSNPPAPVEAAEEKSTPCSMQEAWKALVDKKAKDNLDDQALAQIWYEHMTATYGDNINTNRTPEQWGEIRGHFANL